MVVGEKRSGEMRFISCKKCKYNFEGECEFNIIGSGNDIDKPCREEEELVRRAANDFIDAFCGADMREGKHEYE